ncbi:MAG TPA: hypothetical protein VFO10_10480 [Oligoflexus sp.]|uniref:hypothetical protein n=1 Tax=Oligoflexus sp. TaxID=1971216 RepID=UPI002D80C540|nr:hypothetical protein [Oligoflexus sp.]HET9237669.1 hypothetical protein [Oligoflexus sp.]
MKQLIKDLRIISVLSCMSFGAPAWSQTVEWMNGSVQGNGCRTDDTGIFIFGDEISYVFSSLGINLSDAGGGPKAMNKFCNVSADARVDQGNYVTDFQQVLTYGGIKTQWGSQASIMSFAQFYGHQIKPFKVMLRNGMEFNRPLVSETLSDKETSVAKANWWCKPNRNPKGHLKGRIAVNGQLVSGGEGSVALSAQTFDIKYAASIRWAPCP